MNKIKKKPAGQFGQSREHYLNIDGRWVQLCSRLDRDRPGPRVFTNRTWAAANM